MERRRFLLFAGIGAASIIGFKLCNSKSQKSNDMNDELKELSEKELEIEIRRKLKAGEVLTVEWDCGGDEAIVAISSSTDTNDNATPFSDALHLYIINLLMLPDVGEFSMEGKGKIYEENGNIYLECESILLRTVTFDKNPNDASWEDINEIDEQYSGQFELFKNE
jgi:hypothetical protein